MNRMKRRGWGDLSKQQKRGSMQVHTGSTRSGQMDRDEGYSGYGEFEEVDPLETHGEKRESGGPHGYCPARKFRKAASSRIVRRPP